MYNIRGIKLKKNKSARDSSIVFAGLPKFVRIPLKGYSGFCAEPIVKKDDVVKVGTLIARSNDNLAVNVHSSVSGKVTEVAKDFLSINVFGDEFISDIDLDKAVLKEIPEDKDFILSKIRDAGIVGMGGAGFPTDIKLDIPEGKKIECLILNGLECEPYLTADNRLMLEKAEEIVIGARIVNKLLGIQNAIIAIDENEKEVIEAMTSITKRYVGVNVRALKSKYPQGAEKQLIKAISGKELGSKELPRDVGIVVQNVATVFAIYEAVMKNMPLIQRVVTISGDLVEKPKNYLVRLGTPISFLIDKMGIEVDSLQAVLLNGQMMGESIKDLSISISKTNGGVLLFGLSKEDFEESPCIRCNRCFEGCPMSLQPFAIANMVKLEETASLYKLRVLDCINCGACSYVCPAKIPLLDYIKQAKNEIR